jgi:hypothetical protein
MWTYMIDLLDHLLGQIGGQLLLPEARDARRGLYGSHDDNNAGGVC